MTRCIHHRVNSCLSLSIRHLSKSWRGESSSNSSTHRTADPRLRRYARVLTRNPDRRTIWMQDTLSRALTNSTSGNPAPYLGAWLFTIMHNQNVNNVRRDIRESAQSISSRYPRRYRHADPSASRKMVELDRALARLPLGQRQVILLVAWKACPMRTQRESKRSGRHRPLALIPRATLFASSWISKIHPPSRLCRSSLTSPAPPARKRLSSSHWHPILILLFSLACGPSMAAVAKSNCYRPEEQLTFRYRAADRDCCLMKTSADTIDIKTVFLGGLIFFWQRLGLLLSRPISSCRSCSRSCSASCCSR